MTTRILIADDEAPIRDLLRRLLARRITDLEVRSVESAEEALDILASESFDAVITDYRMQRLTGGDIARWLETHAPTTLRILVTGYNEESFVLQAETGMRLHALMKKPWDNAELVKRVVDLLEARARGDALPAVVIDGPRGGEIHATQAE